MMILKRYFLTAAAATFVLSSCDYVKQPYQNPPTAAVADCPIPTFPANTNTQRNVMLEEFTGHTCAPCPGAGKVARDLIDFFATSGKKFIVVSEHTFDLAAPQPGNFATDFRTDEGDYYSGSLFTPAISYTPVGFVNRTVYTPTSSIWVDKADWQSAATAIFAKPLEINMQMIVNYDSTQQKGCLFVQSEFESSMTGNFFLVVYLTQDSIVDWQTNGSSAVGDPDYPLNTNVATYVHRHVFRGAITGKLGVEVLNGNATAGQQVVNTIGIDLAAFRTAHHRTDEPAMVQKNLAIIAYVYDSATKEVIQVIEQKLIE